MAAMTKLECIIRYLWAKVDPVHYAEITEDMKRIHPDIFHWTFDKRKYELSAFMGNKETSKATSCQGRKGVIYGSRR